MHSPYEIPDSASKPFTVHSRQERDTTVRFLETIADEQLRGLTRRQRRCQFFDEGVKPYPVYSYNLCMMACRRKLCLRYCGCTPFFYGDRGDGARMCDVDGLACLAGYADKLVELREEDPEADCRCYHSCEEIRYTTDRNFERSWCVCQCQSAKASQGERAGLGDGPVRPARPAHPAPASKLILTAGREENLVNHSETINDVSSLPARISFLFLKDVNIQQL